MGTATERHSLGSVELVPASIWLRTRHSPATKVLGRGKGGGGGEDGGRTMYTESGEMEKIIHGYTRKREWKREEGEREIARERDREWKREGGGDNDRDRDRDSDKKTDRDRDRQRKERKEEKKRERERKGQREAETEKGKCVSSPFHVIPIIYLFAIYFPFFSCPSLQTISFVCFNLFESLARQISPSVSVCVCGFKSAFLLFPVNNGTSVLFVRWHMNSSVLSCLCIVISRL